MKIVKMRGKEFTFVTPPEEVAHTSLDVKVFTAHAVRNGADFQVVWVLRSEESPTAYNATAVVAAETDYDPANDATQVNHWLYKVIDELGAVNKRMHIFTTNETAKGNYAANRNVTRLGIIDDGARRAEFRRKKEWVEKENIRREEENETRVWASNYKLQKLEMPTYSKFIPGRYLSCDSWYELPIRSRITKPRHMYDKGLSDLPTEQEFVGRATPEFIRAIEAIIAYETDGTVTPHLPRRNVLPERTVPRQRGAVNAARSESVKNAEMRAKAGDAMILAAAKAMGAEDKLDWED